MNISPAKENILKRIRTALSVPTPLPFPKSEGYDSVYKPASEEATVEFAEQFSKLQGRFVYCVSREELALQLTGLVEKMDWQNIYCIEDALLNDAGISLNERLVKTDLANCDVSVTGCESLVARTGSIVMSSAQQSGRTTSVYAPVHICIAYSSQLVYDVKDALQLLKEKYGTALPSQITFATGPSRTADIEKTLVVGVHGPKEVYVFFVES
ncbi:LUD domain-containing protein [Terrimonas sp. NA20]|uniref:LUD domain-containing protein n=1 Tax=Terrimonas ginsenosidimutans TaxID=2908004 RepID=A0ABS9KQ41_9BACT|nr:LUD domain-containing protein [Terrimonas ginsenosidimutans]MCG2614449.1 LUD domain-containing protein [Terrimonas ginsenosidimutans]